MKNVQKIIEYAGIALDGSEPHFHIVVENEPYMRLVIEGIGTSPDGRQLVSVAHYYYQNGDAMRDPEMVFLVDLEMAGIARGVDGWFPVSYQQDGIGSFAQVAIEWREGKMFKRPKLERDLKLFSRTWNRNIGGQGFVKAAKGAKR